MDPKTLQPLAGSKNDNHLYQGDPEGTTLDKRIARVNGNSAQTTP